MICDNCKNINICKYVEEVKSTSERFNSENSCLTLSCSNRSADFITIQDKELIKIYTLTNVLTLKRSDSP